MAVSRQGSQAKPLFVSIWVTNELTRPDSRREAGSEKTPCNVDKYLQVCFKLRDVTEEVTGTMASAPKISQLLSQPDQHHPAPHPASQTNGFIKKVLI